MQKTKIHQKNNDMKDDQISIFVRRMKRIGIELQLIGNYPWIYLDSVNGNRIKKEDYYLANHGFTIGWSGIKIDSVPHLIDDLDIIFKIIRKYKYIIPAGGACEIQ